MSYTIEASKLTKSFGHTPVLSGLDLRVRTGTVHALLGPNGAGKTTTVRILATLIKPDAGSVVTVLGHDVERAPRRVREAISLTGQYAAVDELLSGEENFMMMGKLRHLGRKAAKRRAAELIDHFELSDARKRRVGTYSGGMRRRLDIALSLVSTPPVIVFDEPTTGLDPRSRRGVWGAVRGLASSGVTVLLTTQYLDEADALADRISVIDRGQVVAEGSAQELKALVGAETLDDVFLTLTDTDRPALGELGPSRR